MRIALLLLVVAGILGPTHAQESVPLETPYTPFDFDHHRKNPTQVASARAIASKPGPDFARRIRTGEQNRAENISRKVSAWVKEPESIPLQTEPEPLPSRNEMANEITRDRYGDTSKGPRDLLARGRIEKDLQLDVISEEDYEVLASRYEAEKRLERQPADSRQDLLLPMPTLVNSKTGGVPHSTSVSQAGVGARTEPRDGQTPFADLQRALRLDQPVTKGTDPLPKAGDRPIAQKTSSTPTASPGAKSQP